MSELNPDAAVSCTQGDGDNFTDMCCINSDLVHADPLRFSSRARLEDHRRTCHERPVLANQYAHFSAHLAEFFGRAKYSCGISHGQGIQEFAGHEQLFQHLLGESHTHEQLLDWADALGLFLMTIEGKDE